ncbi:hypothetical protein R1flu_008592 [Riccia fluitans]|uniref:Uncharacterized protein n=1 Tax=Riccia fluitans TaxID=41844 RepID=A0ABD1YFP8_9MARC
MISFQDGQYPQELTHDQFKQRINSAIFQSEHPDLKLHAAQKYKSSLGITVADSVARDSLLAAHTNWGPKAFSTFASASAPKERYQILVHDIPVNLELKETQTNLLEDNTYLEVDPMLPHGGY